MAMLLKVVVLVVGGNDGGCAGAGCNNDGGFKEGVTIYLRCEAMLRLGDWSGIQQHSLQVTQSAPP
jgi:hypothetical protein